MKTCKVWRKWSKWRKRHGFRADLYEYMMPGDEVDMELLIETFRLRYETLFYQHLRCTDTYGGLSYVFSADDSAKWAAIRIGDCLENFRRLEPLAGRSCAVQIEEDDDYGEIPDGLDSTRSVFETFEVTRGENGGAGAVFYRGSCFQGEVETQPREPVEDFRKKENYARDCDRELYDLCNRTYAVYQWCKDQLNEWLYDPAVCAEELVRRWTGLVEACKMGTVPSREECARINLENDMFIYQLNWEAGKEAPMRLFQVPLDRQIWPRDIPPRTAVVNLFEPEWGRRREMPLSAAPTGLEGWAFKLPLPDRWTEDLDTVEADRRREFGFTDRTYFGQADTLAEFIYRAKESGWHICFACHTGCYRAGLGCGAAVMEHFYKAGLSVFAGEWDHPDKAAFHKLLNALEKYRENMKGQEKL